MLAQRECSFSNLEKEALLCRADAEISRETKESPSHARCKTAYAKSESTYIHTHTHMHVQVRKTRTSDKENRGEKEFEADGISEANEFIDIGVAQVERIYIL